MITDFFTPGTTHTRHSNGDTVRFRCETATSNPSTGQRIAFGFIQINDSPWRIRIMGATEAGWTWEEQP